MKIFERYIFRNLLTASVLIAATLAVLIFLVQSLQFLELVIEAGASGQTFWTLTLLALPRFLEVILPLSLAVAVTFIYNRMTMDSELVVIRSAGWSPLHLAKPALVLALCCTVLLWGMTMWVTPASLAALQIKRHDIKARFSTLLLREGVFNQAGRGLTIYARQRGADGTLYGLMIHDGRDRQKNPSTILAKRGTLSADDKGFQVVVYDGERQEYDPEKQILSRLNFERYIIELPDQNMEGIRWMQPDERTIFELLSAQPQNARLDSQYRRDLKIEVHRRITSPLLAIALVIIPCAALLIGPVDRRGQMRRIFATAFGIITVQSLYIAAFNIARQSDWGLLLMYALVMCPVVAGLILLGGWMESGRMFLPRTAGRTGRHNG